ncbi:MAG TPA: LCP family protein [Mycobacteriales bacterium]|nr:LCP family protein [Mycobacteriales bacterium]
MGTHRRRSSRSVLLLTALSAVLPGTAHLAAGRRRVGTALVTAAVVVLGVAAIVGLRITKNDVLHLVVRPGALTMIEVLAALFALVWIALVVRSYFVVRPPGPRTGERVAGVAVVTVLCVAVAAPPVVVARYAYVQRSLITTLFPDTEVTTVNEGGKVAAKNDPWKGRQRLNTLLIASDAGPDRQGVRTDSMVVLSTDVHTGDTVMFSLPRNLSLRNAQLPPGPLAEKWPNGFTDFDGLLNAFYRAVTETPGLLQGARDRGAQGLKLMIGSILGLRIDDYVLVNLEGFQEFVDAIGGVVMNVPRRLPIGGILGNGQHVAPSGYIEAGVQRLNGFKALWFSRSRSDSDDYERMGRQRCLIGAITKQISPASMLTHFQQIAAATKSLVETDLPQGLLQPLVDLADKMRGKTDIRSVQFVPPLINTSDPNFELIRTKVKQALVPPVKKPVTNPKKPTPTPTATPTNRPGGTTTGGTAGNPSTGGATGGSGIQSVDQACALH